MLPRLGRKWILFIVFIYLVLMALFTNKFCLRYWKSASEQAMLEFTIKVSKNGERYTKLIDENFKFDAKEKVKTLQMPDNELSSKELIFINKKQYENGVVQLDRTQLKQTKEHEMQYETQQEVYKMEPLKKDVEIKKKTSASSSKRYIFSLRYYEQLSMATKNLLSLASLGTYTDRHVVMPFVNGSRFSGLPSGAAMSRFMETRKNNSNVKFKFRNISTYFDVQQLQNQLKDHGYKTLASFHEFRFDCTRLDVVVHFIYKSSEKDMRKWYKMSTEQIEQVHNEVRANNGAVECKFLRKSKITKFLQINVTKYYCVDPEIIRSVEEFEAKVLQNARCVGFVQWKGNGHKRTHFELAPNILNELRPSNLRHNKRLVDIAYAYIRSTVKRPFISVHVRSERYLVRGLKLTRSCFKKLIKTVSKRSSTFHLNKIFLASDLEAHGSDTLPGHASADDRSALQQEIEQGLGHPYILDPKKYNLYDNGEIAIVEMHILSMGESLFTLGFGNFQEWITELFLLHNAEDKSLIYKVCDFAKR